MHYSAFISYSHALDGRLAPALQRGLQRFARKWHELRALAVFRDETSLSTSPHLWQAIEAALAQSDYFILLASPAAAASAWVGREAAWWRANRPLDRLLIVLTEGELAWDPRLGGFRPEARPALPAALDGAFGDEPRFLDLRWARNSADLSLQHPRFKDAVADLAATLHGRPKEDLLGEDVMLFRRQRLARRAAVALLTGLTLAALAGGYLALERADEAARQGALAEERRREAEAARNEAVANLRRAVEAKLVITEASARPDYSLALVLRLLTEPAFALSEAERARYLYLLPELIGRAQVAVVAPAPPEEGQLLIGERPAEWFFATAAGLVEGRPVAVGVAQDSDWARSADRMELRDLLSGKVVGAPLPLAEDEVSPVATFLAEGLLLLDDAATRVVVRLEGGERIELGALPPLPGDGTAQEAARAHGGRYVVDALVRYDGEGNVWGPVALGVLWLEQGRYVALKGGVAGSGDPRGHLELADLGDDRLLLIGPQRLALVDARSGAASLQMANPLPGPLAGGGFLADERLWLADGEELLVYDVAGRREVKRIRHGAEAVVPVRDAPGTLALIACDRPWRLVDGEGLDERATLPSVPCDQESLTPLWRRVLRLLPDGRTLAFNAPHPDDLQPALWLVASDGGGGPLVLPVQLHFDDLLADSSNGWIVLEPSYLGGLVYIRTDERDLLEQARQTLGPLADEDLATLLAL